jgi:hypothetical protein
MIFAVSLGAAGAAGCSEIGGGGRSRPRSPRPSLDVVTSSVFIRRPRLALFVSLVVSLAGLLALLAIPVAQRRNLAARPVGIFCFARYPGNADPFRCRILSKHSGIVWEDTDEPRFDRLEMFARHLPEP